MATLKDVFYELLAGAAGGTAGILATHPLDVVKTRMQSSNPAFASLGMPEIIGTTLKREGQSVVLRYGKWQAFEARGGDMSRLARAARPALRLFGYDEPSEK